MTVNKTRMFFRRKVIVTAINPKRSFIESDAAKFFGMIFAAILLFGAMIAVENFSEYMVSSHKATNQELIEINNPIGIGTKIIYPNYMPLAAAIVIENNSRYELRIIKYDSVSWVPKGKYQLKMLAADGTVLTMDRSFIKAIRMDENEVLPIPTDKEIKRWSIEFLDL